MTAPGPSRPCVEVAVDAAGEGGARTYTYEVPPELESLDPGEAVLVGYGRRQALGIVLGAADRPDGILVRPVIARIRSDGPVLPPLQVELVRAVAAHYLAPVALVVRASLPPGLLERLELVATPARERGIVASAPSAGRSGDGAGSKDELLAEICAAGHAGIPVRRMRAGGSRAEIVRRVRAFAAAGEVTLEWRLLPPASGPRLERLVTLTAEGRAEARVGDPDVHPRGRALGPRQTALLQELADDGGEAAIAAGAAGRSAAELAGRHGAGTVRSLERRGLVQVRTVDRPRRPLAPRPPGPRGALPPDAELAPGQARALEAIAEAVRRRSPRAFLLDGVTGGGKTAVYAGAIAAARREGRGALVLVPEIALALPLVDRLRVELGAEPALVHGGLGEGERADEWRRIRAGEAPIVVGTRTAVLAPLGDPGIVIVDEEHDPSYKADRTPRFQARDVALVLARLASCPVVLGSATPDVATVGRARAGEIERFELRARAAGALPDVHVVDLRSELAAGNRGLLSAMLLEALRALDRDAGDRAILVMNRRGSATVIVCRDCGYVQICPECHRPLVYHAAVSALRCHHCGAAAPVARRCPACSSPRIRYLGGGTERLEREVRGQLPGLRVARLDRDVVERRGAASRVLDAFRDGAVDVLVGTGMVAKALDIPEVTLVGVVSADIALNLPDLRAAERTYQLLVQAVGRAGRGPRGGLAIVQTYQPGHPVIEALARGDPGAFYDAELATRRAFGAPPFGRLVKLTCALPDRELAESAARAFAADLRARAASNQGPATEVLGPVPAYVARRAGRWRFHVVLRGPDPVALLGQDPGPPWSVDVDPESLL